MQGGKEFMTILTIYQFPERLTSLGEMTQRVKGIRLKPDKTT